MFDNMRTIAVTFCVLHCASICLAASLGSVLKTNHSDIVASVPSSKLSSDIKNRRIFLYVKPFVKRQVPAETTTTTSTLASSLPSDSVIEDDSTSTVHPPIDSEGTTLHLPQAPTVAPPSSTTTPGSSESEDSSDESDESSDESDEKSSDESDEKSSDESDEKSSDESDDSDEKSSDESDEDSDEESSDESDEDGNKKKKKNGTKVSKNKIGSSGSRPPIKKPLKKPVIGKLEHNEEAGIVHKDGSVIGKIDHVKIDDKVEKIDVLVKPESNLEGKYYGSASSGIAIMDAILENNKYRINSPEVDVKGNIRVEPLPPTNQQSGTHKVVVGMDETKLGSLSEPMNGQRTDIIPPIVDELEFVPL